MSTTTPSLVNSTAASSPILGSPTAREDSHIKSVDRNDIQADSDKMVQELKEEAKEDPESVTTVYTLAHSIRVDAFVWFVN
nr:hypothetical protein L204_02870 [Cryptococcus depauperatus CBS 7855]